MIASGPFGCADGSLATAMARCMGKTDKPIPVAELAESINTAAEQGLVFRGHHHEIYLSDPRRVPPERLKTILRHPVDQAE